MQKNERKDTRMPLAQGTQFKDIKGNIYTVTSSEVRRGGSSLVYTCERTGSFRCFIIKERFPLTDQFVFTRNPDSLNIIPEKENDLNALHYLKRNTKNA